MKSDKYQDQVCLLDNNVHYRISDVFYMKGTLSKENNINDAISHVLSRPQEYSETLLFKYLKNKNKDSDLEAFGACVKDILSSKNVPYPSNNELTVHMRLGDIMSDHNNVDIEDGSATITGVRISTSDIIINFTKGMIYLKRLTRLM